MDQLTLAITPRAIDRLAAGSQTPRLNVTSALNIEQPLIREIMLSLADEIVVAGLFGHLYAETLARALTMEVLRAFGVAEPQARPGPGALAPWQLRRATTYMMDNLQADASLADLARLVGLSKSQFGRTFKASMGMTPHRWLLNARIRRAQELLLEGAFSIAEVATVTGFSAQSHFTRVFRRIVGMSPGAWQRSHRC